MTVVRPEQRRKSAWRPLAVAASGAAVLVAVGAGVWATLSAQAVNTTPEQVTSGTLKLTLANNGAGFGQSVSNLAPGDVVNRFVTLTNGGTLDGQALTMQVAATGSAALITDGTGSSTTKALRVAVDSCPTAWAPTTGTCSGTVTNLLAATPLSALSTAATLVSGSVTAGANEYLRVQLTLPDQNETTVNGTLPASTIQGLTANLTYTFTETQRTATTTNS
ncbi:TasA family protein [Actinokineospora bangkokensis]|uniref:Uncharacterized protein n=1 Tax=Actinokineospora bangkokensis TaxID=1193682 RepID=A0A1Q9LPZ8_9PSEU|nr:TasA family protein [Actinokineospora bangkokensis]OLR94063.1 hypothetical protein BJP25_13900 [Actinokineospora bangkokensis]